jgi:hypothetical protein
VAVNGSRWWRLWQNYTNSGDGSSSEGRSSPSASGSGFSSKKPFSIDNADLVVSSTPSGAENSEPDLKENLEEDLDYILLPEQVWLALHKW